MICSFLLCKTYVLCQIHIGLCSTNKIISNFENVEVLCSILEGVNTWGVAGSARFNQVLFDGSGWKDVRCSERDINLYPEQHSKWFAVTTLAEQCDFNT